MPPSNSSSRRNASPPTYPASNGASWHVRMRWSVCWERKRVACSMLRAKNLSRGWSRPHLRRKNRSCEHARAERHEKHPTDEETLSECKTDLLDRKKKHERRSTDHFRRF